MIWNFNITAAGAQQTLARLRGHFDGMFNQMSSGITNNITKFNAWQVALDFCVSAGKKLIDESRELIAISTKYDIPISKMGQMQMMAQASGQSVGQLARGFRFLEMNMNKALLKPGGPQYQALREIGFSTEEIEAGSMDTVLAADILRQKLAGVGDESRRNALLQEVFGANWQNVLLIIEQSKTAQADATSAGYKYSTSMTESLSQIGVAMEEIGQDVKPVIMPIVQIIGMLATVLGVLIEGLKLMIQLAGKSLYAAFHTVVGEIQTVVGGLIKAAALVAKLTGFKSIGESVGAFGEGIYDAGQKNFKSAIGEVKSMDPLVQNSKKEVEKSSDRLGRQATAFGESIGLAEEGQYIKDKKKQLENLEGAMRRNEMQSRELSKRQIEMAKAYREGRISQEDYMMGEKKLTELGKEKLKMDEKKKRIQEQLDRAGNKEAVKGGKQPRTDEERKIALQEARQARERSIKMTMAQTPTGMQMETAFEVVKAYEEMKKLKEDLLDLETNHSNKAQAIADMKHSMGLAEIAYMEKRRAHENHMLKIQREREDSEKGRRDDAIKAMQEREQQFMTRQGMTGMDKASVSVENAIQKMQRDEEQLNKVLNDPKRTQDEREAAKKKFEGSTMDAMKEFDKLSLMQFQYSASDAAKKGMGGGLDVRENQLSVAKSSLEYLKKSYEIQLKQFGLSPDQFGNVPFQMQGPLRGGK